MDPLNDGRLIRCLTALMCETWMIRPEMHRELTRILQAHRMDRDTEAAQHELAAAMPANPAARRFELRDRVAIIPVEGVIGRKFSASLRSSGVTSIDVLDRIVQSAASDDEVDAILMVYDSPGGLVTGVPEAASTINKARERKPVMAFADGQMASAAYYLASQSDAIYGTPSARVGSIGVYLALLDETRSYEMEGYRVEMFKSGKYKGMGYPGTSLNDEQRAMLQARVNETAAAFKATVRAGRQREISDDVMQGQDFSVTEALQNGLMDSVTDLDAAVADAASMAKQRKARG